MKKIYLEALGRMVNGNLIEIVPDIIYSLLVNEIGIKQDNLGNNLIDDDSFTECSQKRMCWISAFSLNMIKSNVLINELAVISETVITINSANKLRNIPLDNKDACVCLTLCEIISDNDGFPDVKITNSETIFNSFRIYYRIDYETKEYLKSEYITSDSTSLTEIENSCDGQQNYYTGLCRSSLELYAKGEEYVIESPYIRDRNTAVNLIKHLTERLTSRKEIITLQMVMNEKTLAIEVGDIVQLSLSGINLIGTNYLVSKIIYNLPQKSITAGLYQID
jgi:hypothetical protein